MPKLRDLTGQRFERLVVLGKEPNGKRGVRWLCRCDCGRTTVVYAAYLNNGDTKSCGCRRDEVRRPARTEGDVVIIPITKGMEAVVDAVDADLGAFNWKALKGPKTWYAERQGPSPEREHILLHRMVAERAGMAIDGLEVDHRDGNGLNCRRANLRPATHAQNQCNSRGFASSGFKGVYQRPGNRWQVSITVDGRLKHLGTFASKEEAAEVYEAAARKYQGEFARPGTTEAA